MTVRVLLFAVLRDAAGTGEVKLQLSAGATAASAADELSARFPSLKSYLPRVAFAVNQQYAPGGTELHDGDELALIPPVSGG
jgi:molybdopterin converting factor subunit 1